MDLFAITAPGLESYLADEMREAGFAVDAVIPGGVTFLGDWSDVLRANTSLRGATRILARLAQFRAFHLAQLDKRSRKIDWLTWLRPDIAFRVEAVCRKSKIYHHRAAAQRVTRAIEETTGAPTAPDAPIVIKVRIEDDLCTVSLDTSGASLHKRGLKVQVNKAPMRETLASLFLRASGFDGSYPVYDPMCGSGTFVIEAAEIAAGLMPGRARTFAFSDLACAIDAQTLSDQRRPHVRFFGSDRDAGAVKMSQANADRAGVSDITDFQTCPISDMVPPCAEPGLVIVNPPYGGRIGNKKPLYGLYAAFGARVSDAFKGWQISMITSDGSLAKAAGLDWAAPGPVVNHGGIKVRLWQAQL